MCRNESLTDCSLKPLTSPQHKRKKLLTGFARKSLLFRKGEHQRPGISFHDLQHGFLRLMVPDASSVHHQLLEGYRHTLPQPTKDFSWSWLPDDETYLWTYLPYHLIQGNHRDELTKTVKDLRYVGKKMWLLGANAVVGDIKSAVQVAEQDQGLHRLQRLILLAAHSLAGQFFFEKVLATLLSRVQNESLLQEEVRRLDNTFDFPYLKPVGRCVMCPIMHWCDRSDRSVCGLGSS